MQNACTWAVVTCASQPSAMLAAAGCSSASCQWLAASLLHRWNSPSAGLSWTCFSGRPFTRSGCAPPFVHWNATSACRASDWRAILKARGTLQRIYLKLELEHRSMELSRQQGEQPTAQAGV